MSEAAKRVEEFSERFRVVNIVWPMQGYQEELVLQPHLLLVIWPTRFGSRQEPGQGIEHDVAHECESVWIGAFTKQVFVPNRLTG